MIENKSEADDLLEQAVDWMIRVETTPDDTELQQALNGWREADPKHAEAWQRALRAWGVMGAIPPDRSQWPEASNTPAAKSAPIYSIKRRWPKLGRQVAALAVAACLMVAVWPTLRLHALADHRTGVGEIQQVLLQDGSEVHLGAASAIRILYSDDQRQVQLLAGQAFFQVADNAERPFVVKAEGVEVAVLGTAFDVLLGTQRHAVSVQSGTVSIRREATPEQRLTSGQQLTLERASGVSSIQPIAPHNVAAWREGRLSVHNRSIQDVVEILDRYYGGRIFIANATLAERRVTGSYDLNAPDVALRGLVKPHQGEVLELTPFVRVLRD